MRSRLVVLLVGGGGREGPLPCQTVVTGPLGKHSVGLTTREGVRPLRDLAGSSTIRGPGHLIDVWVRVLDSLSGCRGGRLCRDRKGYRGFGVIPGLFVGVSSRDCLYGGPVGWLVLGGGT